MENNGLGLDFPILDVNFVARQDYGNILANSYQIPMPVGNVLVGDSGCDIKHDDGTLALNVVTISEATKLFLTSSVPNIESDGSSIGMENQRMNFDTQSGNIFLLELASQMSFDKGGFAGTAIANKDELEGGHILLRGGHFSLYTILWSTPKKIQNVYEVMMKLNGKNCYFRTEFELNYLKCIIIAIFKDSS